MKKTIFSLFAFLFVSALCFAQQASVPVNQAAQQALAPVAKPTPAPVETKTLTGKVDLVSIGDATKGTNSEIVVVDESGQKLSFLVKSGTPITDKDGKTLTLSNIMKDNKVIVEYATNKMGTHKAQSIKLVE